MLATETGLRQTGTHKVVVALANLKDGDHGIYAQATGFPSISSGSKSVPNSNPVGAAIGDSRSRRLGPGEFHKIPY